MKLRPSDPSLVDDLLVACREAELKARREGDVVVVTPPRPDPDGPADQARVELLFFARAWALAYDGVRVEISDD
jgi:hypothetical protein